MKKSALYGLMYGFLCVGGVSGSVPVAQTKSSMSPNKTASIAQQTKNTSAQQKQSKLSTKQKVCFILSAVFFLGSPAALFVWSVFGWLTSIGFALLGVLCLVLGFTSSNKNTSQQTNQKAAQQANQNANATTQLNQPSKSSTKSSALQSIKGSPQPLPQSGPQPTQPVPLATPAQPAQPGSSALPAQPGPQPAPLATSTPPTQPGSSALPGHSGPSADTTASTATTGGLPGNQGKSKTPLTSPRSSSRTSTSQASHTTVPAPQPTLPESSAAKGDPTTPAATAGGGGYGRKGALPPTLTSSLQMLHNGRVTNSQYITEAQRRAAEAKRKAAEAAAAAEAAKKAAEEKRLEEEARKKKIKEGIGDYLKNDSDDVHFKCMAVDEKERAAEEREYVQDIKNVLECFEKDRPGGGTMKLEDKDYVSICQNAAMRGDVLMLKALYELLDNRDVQYPVSGDTALMCAAAYDIVDCVKFLADKEAGKKNKDGKTALMLAIEKDAFDCSEVLLSKEEEIFAQDHKSKTALHFVLEKINHCAQYDSNLQKWWGIANMLFKAMCEKAYGDKAQIADSSKFPSDVFSEYIAAFDKKHGGGFEDWNEKSLKDYAQKYCNIFGQEDVFNAFCDKCRKIAVMNNRFCAGYSTIQKLYFSASYLGKEDILAKVLTKLSAQDGYFIWPSEHTHMQNCYDMTALMIAVKNCKVQCCKILSYANLYHAKDASGKTALMMAVECRNKECVELLKDKEWSIQDNNGNTALMYAVEKQNLELVKSLLSTHVVNGLLPQVFKNKQSKTALMIALDNKYYEIADEILTKEYKYENSILLHEEARYEQRALKDISNDWLNSNAKQYCDHYSKIIPTIKAKYDAAADSNKEKYKAILCKLYVSAAYSGNAAVLKDVITHAKDIVKECRVDEQMTALMWAARKGHVECVNHLIDLEAEMRNVYGYTALMLAAKNGKLDCVNALIEKEKKFQDNSGKTALMLAAWCGHLECVNALMVSEAGMTDDSRETALIFAIRYEKFDCALSLLSNKSENIEVFLLRAADSIYATALRGFLGYASSKNCIVSASQNHRDYKQVLKDLVQQL